VISKTQIKAQRPIKHKINYWGCAMKLECERQMPQKIIKPYHSS